MSENTKSVSTAGRKGSSMAVKTMVYCALLTALSIAMARLFGLMPSEFSRFSLEAIPTIIAGILFGPLPGAMVGFASDFIGCLFSPYGFNPIFCLPPILYGLCGGLFRRFLAKKLSFPRLLLTIAPAAVFGSVLWQSFALDLVYGTGFWVLLSTRGIQFAIVMVLEALIIHLLFKSRVFHHLGVWPPKR